jgi:transmembrane protein 231
MLNKLYITTEKKVTYSAPLWSYATLVFLGLGVSILFLPFLFAYLSTSFWPKESSYREQPIVYMTQDSMIMLEGTLTSTSVPFTINFGSDPAYQKYMGSTSRMVQVKVF